MSKTNSKDLGRVKPDDNKVLAMGELSRQYDTKYSPTVSQEDIKDFLVMSET